MKHHIHNTFLSDVVCLEVGLLIISHIKTKAKAISDLHTRESMLDKIEQSMFIIDSRGWLIMVYYSNQNDFIEYPIGNLESIRYCVTP